METESKNIKIKIDTTDCFPFYILNNNSNNCYGVSREIPENIHKECQRIQSEWLEMQTFFKKLALENK
jgi:hypothetical protein